MLVDRKSFHLLFLPLLSSGIVISTVGIILRFLGEMIGSDGEGFSIIGVRLLIGGAITVFIAFYAQYYHEISKSLLILKFLFMNFIKRHELSRR
jgi:hypothetical protein